MEEIDRQLQDLKLKEQELQKQRLRLEKQKHEEEIKKIDDMLKSEIVPNQSVDISALTQLLME